MWQIVLCLGTALLFGAILGWFFRGDCKQELGKTVDDWSQRFAFVEDERNVLAVKVQDRDRLSYENKSLLSRLTAMDNGANLASNVLKDNKEKLDIAEHELAKRELLLEQCHLEIVELKESLVTTVKKESKIKKVFSISKELNLSYEKKMLRCKTKLDQKTEELLFSQAAEQSSLNEIAAIQALLDVYEKDSGDLLEKEGQLKKALSSIEVLNQKHEKQMKKRNAKIEKLTKNLESSKEKELESEDELKAIFALLEEYEKGNDNLSGD